MTTRYETQGPVAVLTLDHPPVNGLGWAIRRALAAGVQRAVDDAAVSALVITGSHGMFSGGADIREFGSPQALAEPHLLSLIALLEACPKPVVAALNGTCMGGGLELALGCHFRVAARGIGIGLPEVKLGLLPGAGGTQRLPRALDVETALNMIISGQPLPSEQLAALPGQALIDELLPADPVAFLPAALAFAQRQGAAYAGRPQDLPRLRQRPAQHPQAQAYFQFVRNSLRARAPQYPAPLRCVDAVQAAVERPFDEGLALERAAFTALMFTPESLALRHAFFAERAAGKVAGVTAATPRRPLRQAGVVGGGTMGSGIAICFLNAGIPLTLLEAEPTALQRGLDSIHAHYAAQLKKGKCSAEQMAQRLALLQGSLDYASLAGADLVVEAVFEDLAVKQQVFRQLDAVLKPGAILASNTSTLDLNRIAAVTARPQDVLGLHFFSPAPVMKLLEVVRGAHTAPEVLATAMALAKTLRKTAVVAGVCDGFIGNRMLEQYSRQAGFLLDEGCTPQQVDQAAERFGFAMGPFRVADLAGNDIAWAIRQRRYVEQPQLRYSPVADRLCELGRYGQKTGAGWYDYAPGRREALPSAQVQQLIEAQRQAAGIRPRAIADEEIIHRLVYALVNEGARLLEEGIAARASDIDLVYLSGYGFPPHRGGPMHYAEAQGLFNVLRALQRFAANPHDDAAFWQPAPLLARLAAAGQGFSAAVAAEPPGAPQ